MCERCRRPSENLTVKDGGPCENCGWDPKDMRQRRWEVRERRLIYAALRLPTGNTALELVGMVESPAVAAHIVELHNADVARAADARELP